MNESEPLTPTAVSQHDTAPYSGARRLGKLRTKEPSCRYPISKSPRRRRCSASPPLAQKLGIPEDALEPYGHYKAKVSLEYMDSLAETQGRQADPRDRDQPDARGRRQDHDHRRPRRRAQQDRQEGGDLPARALARPGVRHEGRRGGRRLRAGRADGGHQPALHRRLQRDRARQQPARGACSTTTSTTATSSASTCAASRGSA